MGGAVDLLFQTNNDCFIVVMYLHSCKDEEQFAKNVIIYAYGRSGNFCVVKINLPVLLFRVRTFHGLGQPTIFFMVSRIFHYYVIKYGSYLDYACQDNEQLIALMACERNQGML